jgi:hypothetical protein
MPKAYKLKLETNILVFYVEIILISQNHLLAQYNTNHQILLIYGS